MKNLDTSLDPPDDQDQDHPIILRAQAGDRDAFGHLYSTYFPQVRAFISTRVVDETTADDIAADTWEAACKSIDQFDLRRGQFVPWVIGIARHVLVDHVKRSEQHNSLDQTGADGELRLDLADAGLTPDGRALGRDDLARVSRALDTLPARRREALRLQVRDGLSVAGVAKAMGVTSAAAHSLLHRGRRQLRDVLDGTRSPDHQDRRRATWPGRSDHQVGLRPLGLGGGNQPTAGCGGVIVRRGGLLRWGAASPRWGPLTLRFRRTYRTSAVRTRSIRSRFRGGDALATSADRQECRGRGGGDEDAEGGAGAQKGLRAWEKAPIDNAIRLNTMRLATSVCWSCGPACLQL